ncbi:MAG TPA: sulfatase-like hydrolase/transferase [Chthoniobacterales bacterium]|nr:sulfatase-like hydrolase/transferase [Chthoniobacterales bacterium]
MPRQRRAPLSLITGSCWLALVLIVAKAFSWTDAWERGIAPGLLTLAKSSWTDVLFALCCGAIGDVIVLLVRRNSRAAAIIRGLFIALFTAFAVYGIVGVGVFHYFMRPLTFELLTMIGNAATVRSSVAERITWPFTAALLIVPPLFACLAGRWPPSRWFISGAVGAAAIWVAVGYTQLQKGWPYQTGHNVWLSPHAELIRTTAIRLTRARRPEFPKDFPPEYVDEFRTFGARNITQLGHFQAPPDVPRPRNTIVIVLESIGTKYLRLYGHEDEFMPNLTAESRHALVFDNFYAHASFTYASFRPINFSVYPGLPWHWALLDNARPRPGTLASALRERGARTAYLTSGDLDWGDQRWLLEGRSGFDIVEGAVSLGCGLLSSWGTTDRCLFDRLIQWIDEDRERPFFAVCWTDQTHDPYLLGPGETVVELFEGKSPPPFARDLTRYLNLMREVDAQIGRVFAALRERGMADDTLVVITGDHGEAFADPHGQRGHAFSVFDEEVRVPLMIWNPRLFPMGERIPTLGGHVDLNPTLADMLNVPPEREWQGYSMFDPARPNRVFLMAVAGGDIFGVRDEQWKYFYDVTSARESLFDLGADPNEQIDIATREPAVSLQLRQRVAAWVTFEDAFLWGKEN